MSSKSSMKCESSTTPGPGTGGHVTPNSEVERRKYETGPVSRIIPTIHILLSTVACPRSGDTLLGFIRKYVNHCPAQQLTHSHWWWCIVCAMLTEWSMLSVCPDIYLDIRIQWYSHLHPASTGPRHNQISRYFSCSHYPTCKYIYCPSSELCHPLLCETFSMEPKVDK